MDNQHSKPDTPAQKAWEQMKELLEKEMPANTVKRNNNNRKYSILLLLLLIGSCGIYKLYNSGQEKAIAVNNVTVSPNESKGNAPVSESHLSTPGAAEPANTSNDERELISKSEEPGSQIHKTENPKPLKTNNENVLVEQHVNKAVANPLSQSNQLKTADAITANRRTSNNSVKSSTVTKANISSLISENKLAEKVSKEVMANNFITPLDTQKNIAIDPTFPPVKNTSTIENRNTLATTVTPSNDTATPKNVSVSTRKESQKKIVKISPDKDLGSFHAGLEWGITPFNNNTVFKEGNARSRPLTALIPSIWISRSVGKKSTLYLAFNPYSQYFFNKNATIHSGNYTINAVGASTISQPAAPTYLAQTFSVRKIMGVEIALQYAYQLSKKWSAGLALGNTWANTALINETITRNKTSVLKDSLYGVIKTDQDWQYINKSFVTGKANLTYRFKHFHVGVSLSKSLTNAYKTTDEKVKSPVNTQLFFRLAIK